MGSQSALPGFRCRCPFTAPRPSSTLSAANTVLRGAIAAPSASMQRSTKAPSPTTHPLQTTERETTAPRANGRPGSDGDGADDGGARVDRHPGAEEHGPEQAGAPVHRRALVHHGVARGTEAVCRVLHARETLDRPLVQGEVGVGIDHARGDRAGHVRGHVLPCPVETRDQLLLDVLEAVLRDEIEGPAVEDVDAARPQPPRGVRAHDDGDRRAGGLVGVEQLLQVHHRHRGPVRDDEGVRVGLDPGVAHAAGGAARAPVLEVIDAHGDRRAVEVRADGTRLAVGADRRARQAAALHPAQRVGDERLLRDGEEGPGSQLVQCGLASRIGPGQNDAVGPEGRLFCHTHLSPSLRREKPSASLRARRSCRRGRRTTRFNRDWCAILRPRRPGVKPVRVHGGHPGG